MHTPSPYVPSQLLGGDAEQARERAYTRWLSRDLRQPAAEFCKNLGLVAAYCESSQQGTRYLFWRMPPGGRCEVRSGRARDTFAEFDRANQERGWQLLSLHVSEDDLYSAVWVSAPHYESGVAFLRFFGISPAERKAG